MCSRIAGKGSLVGKVWNGAGNAYNELTGKSTNSVFDESRNKTGGSNQTQPNSKINDKGQHGNTSSSNIANYTKEWGNSKVAMEKEMNNLENMQTQRENLVFKGKDTTVLDNKIEDSKGKIDSYRADMETANKNIKAEKALAQNKINKKNKGLFKKGVEPDIVSSDTKGYTQVGSDDIDTKTNDELAQEKTTQDDEIAKKKHDSRSPASHEIDADYKERQAQKQAAINRNSEMSNLQKVRDNKLSVAGSPEAKDRINSEYETKAQAIKEKYPTKTEMAQTQALEDAKTQFEESKSKPNLESPKEKGFFSKVAYAGEEAMDTSGGIRKKLAVFAGMMGLSAVAAEAGTLTATPHNIPTSHAEAGALQTSSETLGTAEFVGGLGTMAAETMAKYSTVAMSAAKFGSKVMPGVGIAFGTADAAYRASEGDELGASMSAGIAAVSTVPVVGTAAAITLGLAQVATDSMGITGTHNQNVPAHAQKAFSTPTGFNTTQAVNADNNSTNIQPVTSNENTSASTEKNQPNTEVRDVTDLTTSQAEQVQPTQEVASAQPTQAPTAEQVQPTSIAGDTKVTPTSQVRDITDSTESASTQQPNITTKAGQVDIQQEQGNQTIVMKGADSQSVVNTDTQPSMPVVNASDVVTQQVQQSVAQQTGSGTPQIVSTEKTAQNTGVIANNIETLSALTQSRSGGFTLDDAKGEQVSFTTGKGEGHPLQVNNQDTGISYEGFSSMMQNRDLAGQFGNAIASSGLTNTDVYNTANNLLMDMTQQQKMTDSRMRVSNNASDVNRALQHKEMIETMKEGEGEEENFDG